MSSYWNRHKKTLIRETIQVLERNDVKSHICDIGSSLIYVFLKRTRKYIILCGCGILLNAILLLEVFLISYQNFYCYNIYNDKTFV